VENFVGNTFSPSSLEVYAQCPFRFLGERVWKQREFVEKEELAAPADEGILLHATLAKFLGKHLREKLPKHEFAVLWEELKGDFEAVCTEFIANGTLEQNELWQAEQGRLLNTLRRWLRYEYDLQEVWDFVPCAVEWDFSSKNGKPLRLSLPSGKKFAIMGRLDRIDANGDKVFVTDYKLSGTPAGSDLPAGIDLQLPVYLLAASELYGKEVAGGGYLSLKAGERKATVKLDDTVDFPFNKRSVDYFKDAEDKWRAFREFSTKLLEDYVQGIYDGDFRVEPKKKCSPYCPLKDICRLSIVNQGGEADE
jgi:ATP-dependent helicase/nuclease subunit B